MKKKKKAGGRGGGGKAESQESTRGRRTFSDIGAVRRQPLAVLLIVPVRRLLIYGPVVKSILLARRRVRSGVLRSGTSRSRFTPTNQHFKSSRVSLNSVALSLNQPFESSRVSLNSVALSLLLDDVKAHFYVLDS